MLTVTTLELFPTEVRAISMSVCMSFGLLSGVALPWVDGLSSNMLILILLIYATATVSSIFITETYKEEDLKNLFEEIYPV